MYSRQSVTMRLPPLAVLLLCSLSSAEDIAASCNSNSDIPACTCPDGTVLSPDSQTCKVPATILLGMNRGITAVTEGEAEVKSVLPVRATCFDFHYKKKEIIAYADNNIMRYTFAGELRQPGAPVAVITPTSRVSSLAVDWVHQDVYWISQQRSAIESASLTGNGLREVVVDEGEGPSPMWSNLVVDPYEGKLFWLGRKGVFSCDLKGKNLKSNLTSWPVDAEDIALDTREQLIYTIGNHGNSVNKVVAASRYDGTRVGDLVALGQSGSKVFGFGIIGSVLYWESNHEGENLYRCEIPTAGGRANVTLVEELYQIVNDMKIYHPDIQKSEKKI